MMCRRVTVLGGVNGSLAGAAVEPDWRVKKQIILALSLSLFALCSVSVRGQSNDGLWKTYMEAAGKAQQNKNYDEAEKLYKLAEVKAKEFGETDERYVRTLANLAALYFSEKKYEEAERPYKQILVSLEKGAGSDSLANASLVRSLAQFYDNEKRYAEAEPLYKYALAIYKRGMKPNDKNLIIYVHFLGNNYFAQKKLKEAEEAFKEELEILERDPDLNKDMQTAYTLGYLALISQNFQKYGEAEKYMRRAVDVARNQRGENHPETASMQKALALILWAQETRFTDAVKEMERVLQTDEAVYGKASKNVAADLDFLASGYRFQARYDEALPLLTRALGILEAIPTTRPEDFSGIAYTLADTYARKHNYAQGEAVCKSMNGIFEKRSQRDSESDLLVYDCLGNVYFNSGNHVAEIETLKSWISIAEKLGAQKEAALAEHLTLLAAIFLRQLKYDDALATLQRAEKIYNKTPSTPNATFLTVLARYYYFTGKYAESEQLFIKSLALVEPKKDISSEQDAAIYRKGYALLLYAQGRAAQAEEMFRKAIDKLKASKTNGERNVSLSYHELATLFTTQGKYTEAEPLFKQAIELREKALGANHPELAASLEGYAGLLKKTGRAGEAASMESRAQAIRAQQPSRKID